MLIIIFAAAGYVIGSIPVAFLLARRRHGIDLRHSGSRNIGARNAYEATNNKRTGFAVLVLDMHKGIIPLVILASTEFSSMIPVVMVTIVLGHCYPIWLKFHGGRGLATTLAIALLTNGPLLILLWIVLYFASGIFKSQVHLQSFVATAGCLIIEFFIPLSLYPMAMNMILIIILSRHIEPVYHFVRKAK